jgi:hypothetical protein
MDFDLPAMSISPHLLKQRSSDYLSSLIVSNIRLCSNFLHTQVNSTANKGWPSKGLIAQWIRARVSEARSRGFNSLFAQSNSLKIKLFFYFTKWNLTGNLWDRPMCNRVQYHI